MLRLLRVVLVLITWPAATALGQLPESAPARSSLPPAPALCGAGTLNVMLGGNAAGEEQFEVLCRSGGGYAARGHTVLDLGGSSADYITTIELDERLVPSLVIAAGTTSTGPLNDTLHLRGDSSTLTRFGGAPQVIPSTPDAAYLGNNLFWPIRFVVARYDRARGGTQEIPVFPSVPLRLTYMGPDTVRETPTGASLPTTYHRFKMVVVSSTLTLWMNSEGRFAGLVLPAARLSVFDSRDAAFAAALAERAGAGTALAAPDYSAPAGSPFGAEEVQIDAGDSVTLAGTLLLPKSGAAPYAAVITITGSGQQTRDESLPIPGLEDYAPFRQIAESLATNGIAVLRVDDRGVGKSTGGETLEKATTTTFAGDVRAQLRYLRGRADIDPDRIALIGHSEGGLIAPMVAAGDSSVAALVLMAGTALPGDSVLVEQMGALLASDSSLSEAQRDKARADQFALIQKLKNGEDVSGLSGVAWLREFISLDPRSVLTRVTQPVLILQGGHDQQVLPRHAELAADAIRGGGNSDVTVRLFPDLNHLFLPSKTGAVSEYGSLDRQTLGSDVLGAIVQFLTRTIGGEQR
jgi:pimeloyl-ACP methyl ester carboxylesterase